MLPEGASRAERVSVGAGFPGPPFSANSHAGGRKVGEGQFFDYQRQTRHLINADSHPGKTKETRRRACTFYVLLHHFNRLQFLRQLSFQQQTLIFFAIGLLMFLLVRFIQCLQLGRLGSQRCKLRATGTGHLDGIYTFSSPIQ